MNRNQAIIELLKGKRLYNGNLLSHGCYVVYRDGGFKYVNGRDGENDRVMGPARDHLNDGAWDDWEVIGEEEDFTSPFGITSDKLHILDKYDIEPLDLEELLA